MITVAFQILSRLFPSEIKYFIVFINSFIQFVIIALYGNRYVISEIISKCNLYQEIGTMF